MPVVDAHIHLFGPGFLPERWHDATANRWAHAVYPPRDPAAIRDKIDPGLHDLDGSILMKELDRNGIDAAVCLGLDWGMGMNDEPDVTIDQQMRHLAMLQNGPLKGRFFVVCGIDPRRDFALDMFEHSVKVWGMKGFKMYPPCGYYPYDEVCQPFYSKAVELGVPVVFHTATSMFPLRARFAHPRYLNDVQAAFPELQIVAAHAGHPFWGDEAIQVADRHPYTYLEISNWNEEAVHDPERLTRFLVKARDHIGAHRILFGTDHFGGPRFSGESRSVITPLIQHLRELPSHARAIGSSFSQEEVDLILGENAVRVFNLEVKKND